MREFVTALNLFMIVLSEDAEEILDMYCRGMVFGITSTKTVVNVGNIVRKYDKEHADEIKELKIQERKGKKGKQSSMWDSIIKITEKIVDGKLKDAKKRYF